MADIPDLSFKPSFPIASVIQAAQQNAALQQQAREQGQKALIDGLNSIGQAGAAIIGHRQRIAQAMANAQLYGQTPEGQQLLGTNDVSTSPTGQPVTMNQTAQGTDGSGNIQPPTPNQSPVNMQTLQTAMMGEQPGNLLANIATQANQRRQMNMQQSQFAQQQSLEGQKELNTQALADKRLQGLLAILKGNTATKESAIGQEDINSLRKEREALVTNNGVLGKQLPSNKFTGLFAGEGAANAQSQLLANQKRIAEIDAKLNGGQQKSNANNGNWQTTQAGINYLVNE